MDLSIHKSQSTLNKEAIMDLLLRDDYLIKLIAYDNVDEDLYEMPNLTMKDKARLINDRIFKHKRFPSNKDNEDKTYLSMEFGTKDYSSLDKYNRRDVLARDNYFVFYYITKESLCDTFNGDRLDEIEERIVKILIENQSIENEDGTVFLKNIVPQLGVPIETSDNFLGRMLTVHFKDTNDEVFGINRMI